MPTTDKLSTVLALLLPLCAAILLLRPFILVAYRANLLRRQEVARQMRRRLIFLPLRTGIATARSVAARIHIF